MQCKLKPFLKGLYNFQKRGICSFRPADIHTASVISPYDLWQGNLFGIGFRIWYLHLHRNCMLHFAAWNNCNICCVTRRRHYQTAKSLGIHNFFFFHMSQCAPIDLSCHPATRHKCMLDMSAAMQFVCMCKKKTHWYLKGALVNKLISARFIFRLENGARLAYMQRGFACLTSSQPLCWK